MNVDDGLKILAAVVGTAVAISKEIREWYKTKKTTQTKASKQEKE